MAGVELRPVLGHLRRLAGDPGEHVADAELLRRFAADRDEAAFAALVRRHGPLVFGVCRRVLGNVHDADDAFQAAFLVLARRAGAIRRGEAVGAWLYRVATHAATKARRAMARRRTHERNARPATPAAPEAEAAWRELQAILQEELARLPEKYRAPFALCCLEGKGGPEAARLLGWKEGTVTGRLTQARRLLRRRLARRGVELPAVLPAAALGRPADAAVPAALAAAAVRVGLAGAAGGVVPAPVAALAGAVTRALAASATRTGAVLLLIASLGLAGAGLGARLLPPPAPDSPPPGAPGAAGAPVARTAPARTDRYGDPLPAGAVARLGTVRLRPGRFVHLLRYRSGGNLLFSASAGERGASAVVWEAATGKPTLVFDGDADWVHATALAPDGRTLAAACHEGLLRHRVRLWDLATGRELPAPGAMGDGAFALAFAPDGQALAGACIDQFVRVWDRETGAERVRFPGPANGVARLAFTPNGERLAVGAWNAPVELWDVASGTLVHRLGQAVAGEVAVAFAPGGNMLAAGGSNDPLIRVWEVAGGREVLRLRGGRGTHGLAFGPDGKLLATGDVRDHTDQAAASPVRLWDVATGRELRRLPGHRYGVSAVAFSPDGKRLASATDIVRQWDVATGAELSALPEPATTVWSVAFAPDGRTVATAEFDGTIRVWDAGTGRPVRRMEGGHGARAYRVAFAPDGRLLASAGGDGTVRLWDPATGREVRRLRGEGGALIFAPFAPTGHLLATCGRGKVLQLWDAGSGKEVRRITAEGAELSHPAFSPDGKRLAFTARLRADSYAVVLVDTASGKAVRRWPVAEGGPVAFAPDGRTLAWVENEPSRETPRALRTWDVATGRERVWPTPQRLRMFSLAYAPDGRTLAWGDVAGNVTLWEVASGRVRCRLRGHRSPVSQLAFAPDGKRLASSGDMTALLWEPAGLVRTRPETLVPGEADALWADLASADAARAYRAVETLAACPRLAVPLLGGRLKPAVGVDRQRVARWVADLGSERFAARAEAMRELERLGDAAASAVREARAGGPSLEVRRRLDLLLDKLQDPVGDPDRVRQLRAVEALEHMGTPAARDLLRKVAAGAAGVRLTEEAKASLERLARRPSAP